MSKERSGPRHAEGETVHVPSVEWAPRGEVPMVTLTIRLPEQLKRAIERVASASDRSMTSFLVRAFKEKLAPRCAACGRGAEPEMVPAKENR